MKSTLSIVLKCMFIATFVVFALGQRSLFDPQKNTRLSFAYNFSDPNTMIAVVLTTSDTRVNNTFFFDPTVQLLVPRFISCVQVVPDNTTYGTALFPPLQLAELQTNASVHYFRISNNTGYNYIISGSKDSKISDFPELGQTFVQLNVKPADVPALTDYQTIVYSTLVSHNAPMTVQCQYTVVYTGIIRSILINDNKKGQWGVTSDDILSQQNYTSGPVQLNPTEIALLTIVGYRLNLISFDIFNCQNDDGKPITNVPVNVSTFLAGNRITSPKNVTYIKQTASCQASAERCINQTISLECEYGYFRADSRCRSICPADQTTVTGYNDCTNFTYEEIRKGYKTISEVTKTKTTFSYYIDLPQDSQVLTIFWPTEQLIITPTTIWFPNSSYLFSEAIMTIQNVPATGYLDYSVLLDLLHDSTLALGATRQITYTQHQISTDPNKTLMAVSYASEPLTDQDKLSPRSFGYLPHNRLLKVNNQTFNYISTFLQCNEACTISILADGHVTATKNARTFLFDLDFGLEAWTYTIPNTFTGIIDLTFTTRNTSNFKFVVSSRDYIIFSHGFPLAKQTLSVPQGSNSVVDATSASCANGQDGVCYSCNAGYYLNPDTKTCVTSCPTGYLTYPTDRKCFKSQCNTHTVQRDNGFCTPQCDKQSVFYIEGQGCVGQCLQGCTTCSNSTGVCIDCAYKDPVSFITQCSHCPPGTAFDDVNHVCKTTSGLAIMGSSEVSQCSDLILVASMDPVEEAYLAPMVFTWTVKTVSSNIDISGLQIQLLSETSKEIVLPSSLLTSNIKYSFTVSYSNAINQTISASFVTMMVSGVAPQAFIDGGSSQVLYHYDDNALKVRVVYSEGCINHTEPFKVSWTQKSGASLALSGDAMPSSYWLDIPRCTLKPGTTYELQAAVTIDGSSTSQNLQTTFRVPPVNFTVDIQNANRDYPVNSAVKLHGLIDYRAGTCGSPNYGSLSYVWSCQIKNTGETDIFYDKCSDPNLLFGNPSSSDLNIPTTYLTFNTTLKIGLTITTGTYSATNYATISIVDTNAVTLALTCENCNSYSYPETVSFKTVATSQAQINPSQITYQWTASSKLPTTSFQNMFKVTRTDSVLSALNYLDVTCTATDNSITSSAYMDLLVDPAPQSGSLTITPTTGYSLSTLFHISAENWDDFDAPLSYEFFGTFGTGEEFRLTDKQKFPYIYTMLPGDPSSNELTIRVAVSDSLRATSSAYASVNITTRGDGILDELRTLRSNFGGMTVSGDSSISTGDPLEMLKTLTFMTREMTGYENLPISSSLNYLNSTQVKEVSGFKAAMMNNIKIVQSLIPTSETAEMMLQAMNAASYNTYFNSPSTLLFSTRTMTSIMGTTTSLTSAEVNSAAGLVSNVISNFVAGTYPVAETKELREFTMDWLNKFSSSYLADKIPGDSSLTVSNPALDAYVVSTTGCSLIRTPIKTSTNSPGLTFNVIAGHENDTTLGCDKGYNLVYYAFNPGKSAPQAAPTATNSSRLLQNATVATDAQKSLLAITITDLEGNVVKLPLTYILNGTDICPTTCATRADGSCRCTSINTFNFRRTVNKVFGLSDDPKPVDILWTVPFWATVISVGWLLLTLIIVTCIIPRYCRVARYENLTQKTRCKSITAGLWVSHVFFNIYTYYDQSLSKARRAFLYFLRIQLFSVLACVLVFWTKHSTIPMIILQFVLPVVLIPFGTIYIINAILSRLLRSYNVAPPVVREDASYGAQSEDEVSQRSSIISPVKAANSKCSFFIGLILYILLVAGALAFTWYEGINERSVKQRNTWAVCLALGLAVDFVVAQLVLIVLRYLVTKIYRTKTVQKSHCLRGFFGIFADPKMIALRQEQIKKKKVNPNKFVEAAPQKPVDGKQKPLAMTNSEKQISMGGALPEYYENVGLAKHKDAPENELARANVDASMDMSRKGPRRIDGLCMKVEPINYQQSQSDSIVDSNIPSIYKDNNQFKSKGGYNFPEESSRLSGPPSLNKLDTQNQQRTSVGSLSLPDVDEENRPLQGGKRRPTKTIVNGRRGTEMELASIQESAIFKPVDISQNTDGEFDALRGLDAPPKAISVIDPQVNYIMRNKQSNLSQNKLKPHSLQSVDYTKDSKIASNGSSRDPLAYGSIGAAGSLESLEEASKREGVIIRNGRNSVKYPFQGSRGDLNQSQGSLRPLGDQDSRYPQDSVLNDSINIIEGGENTRRGPGNSRFDPRRGSIEVMDGRTEDLYQGLNNKVQRGSVDLTRTNGSENPYYGMNPLAQTGFIDILEGGQTGHMNNSLDQQSLQSTGRNFAGVNGNGGRNNLLNSKAPGDSLNETGNLSQRGINAGGINSQSLQGTGKNFAEVNRNGNQNNVAGGFVNGVGSLSQQYGVNNGDVHSQSLQGTGKNFAEANRNGNQINLAGSNIAGGFANGAGNLSQQYGVNNGDVHSQSLQGTGKNFAEANRNGNQNNLSNSKATGGFANETGNLSQQYGVNNGDNNSQYLQGAGKSFAEANRAGVQNSILGSKIAGGSVNEHGSLSQLANNGGDINPLVTSQIGGLNNTRNSVRGEFNPTYSKDSIHGLESVDQSNMRNGPQTLDSRQINQSGANLTQGGSMIGRNAVNAQNSQGAPLKNSARSFFANAPEAMTIQQLKGFFNNPQANNSVNASNEQSHVAANIPENLQEMTLRQLGEYLGAGQAGNAGGASSNQGKTSGKPQGMTLQQLKELINNPQAEKLLNSSGNSQAKASEDLPENLQEMTLQELRDYFYPQAGKSNNARRGSNALNGMDQTSMNMTNISKEMNPQQMQEYLGSTQGINNVQYQGAGNAVRGGHNHLGVPQAGENGQGLEGHQAAEPLCSNCCKSINQDLQPAVGNRTTIDLEDNTAGLHTPAYLDGIREDAPINGKAYQTRQAEEYFTTPKQANLENGSLAGTRSNQHLPAIGQPLRTTQAAGQANENLNESKDYFISGKDFGAATEQEVNPYDHIIPPTIDPKKLADALNKSIDTDANLVLLSEAPKILKGSRDVSKEPEMRNSRFIQQPEPIVEQVQTRVPAIVEIKAQPEKITPVAPKTVTQDVAKTSVLVQEEEKVAPGMNKTINPMLGKDETWYGQEMNNSKLPSKIADNSVADVTSNTIRIPNVPSVDRIPSKEVEGGLDATMNASLFKNDEFSKKHLRRRKLTNNNTSTTKATLTDGASQFSVAFAGNNYEGQRQSRPSSMAASSQKLRRAPSQDQQTIERPSVIRMPESPIGARGSVQVKPSLSRTLSHREDKEGGMNQTQVKPVGDVSTNQPNNLSFTQSRIDRYRLPASNRKGDKLRMSSVDTKSEFEVRLGKQTKPMKGKACDHHEMS